MEFEIKKIEDLKPNTENEYIHTQAQIEDLAKVIKKFGFDVPIVIDENNTIIKGHARLEALTLLAQSDDKYKETKCIVKRGLSESEKIALRISDNRIPEFSQWDENALVVSFKKIEKDLLDFTLFNDNQIETLINENDISDDYNDMISEVKDSKEIFHTVELVFSTSEKKTDFLKISKELIQSEGAIERGDAVISFLKKNGK